MIDMFLPFLHVVFASYFVFRWFKSTDIMPSPLLLVWLSSVFLYFFPSLLLGNYINNNSFASCLDLFYFIVLISCVFFSLGWCLFEKKSINIKLCKSNQNNNRLELVFYLGFFLALFGEVLYLVAVLSVGGPSVFYGGAHSNIKRELSGYLYEGIHIAWFGLCICLCSFGVIKKYNSNVLFSKKTLLLLSISICIPLAADAILIGQRGGIISLAMVFLSAMSIASEGRLTPKSFFIGWRGGVFFTLILLVLLMPTIRHFTHLGTVSDYGYEKAENFEISKIFAGSTTDDGNEIVFAASQVCAFYKLEEFDYGKKMFFVFVNFIPSSWWLDKPGFHDFSVNSFDTIASAFGWMPVEHSVETGIADMYARFGLMVIVFWFLFGAAVAIFVKTIRKGVVGEAFYGMFLTTFIYFMLQNFYPFSFRFIVFLACYLFVSIISNTRFKY